MKDFARHDQHIGERVMELRELAAQAETTAYAPAGTGDMHLYFNDPKTAMLFARRLNDLLGLGLNRTATDEAANDGEAMSPADVMLGEERVDADEAKYDAIGRMSQQVELLSVAMRAEAKAMAATIEKIEAGSKSGVDYLRNHQRNLSLALEDVADLETREGHSVEAGTPQ